MCGSAAPIAAGISEARLQTGYLKSGHDRIPTLFRLLLLGTDFRGSHGLEVSLVEIGIHVLQSGIVDFEAHKRIDYGIGREVEADYE
jgi:hypothetical protein